jgi:RHS repeat-associated protein
MSAKTASTSRRQRLRAQRCLWKFPRIAALNQPKAWAWNHGLVGLPPVTSTANSQITYSLDAAGNLTSDGLRLFEYDGQNRLVKVLVSQSAEASKISYLHNALGQRVFKSEPQVAQTAPDEATLGLSFIDWLKKNFGWLFAQAQANATLGQSYVYSDDNLGGTPVLLGEYGNGGNKSAGRIEYMYLPLEDGTSMPIGLMKANRFYAIQADHLHTPRLIRDDAHKPVWQWAYSAFGDNKPSGLLKATPNPKAAITNQPVLLKATNPLEINLRFPGQYFDEESNLNYNYFRTYQPTQGRYTQPDPIGLEGGLNRYKYAESNPLMFTDPLGLDHSRLYCQKLLGRWLLWWQKNM